MRMAKWNRTMFLSARVNIQVLPLRTVECSLNAINLFIKFVHFTRANFDHIHFVQHCDDLVYAQHMTLLMQPSFKVTEYDQGKEIEKFISADMLVFSKML